MTLQKQGWGNEIEIASIVIIASWTIKGGYHVIKNRAIKDSQQLLIYGDILPSQHFKSKGNPLSHKNTNPRDTCYLNSELVALQAN